MPKRFIHLAFSLFIITALSGLWLRVYSYLQRPTLPYDHILHGHSHIAVLGWAFFALYIILLKILWPNLKQRKHATILGTVIFAVSFIMFFAFLYEGYATYSIILSTLHIFVEYWAIVFIIRRIREHQEIPTMSRLFFYGSLFSLFLSTLGPFALGYLGASGLRESPFFDMSIYFFLHFQYNGFLTLFLIGLLLTIFYHRNVAVNDRLAKRGFWVYMISLFPWFISAILWADLGSFAKVIATIGSIGQFIGVILFILALREHNLKVKNSFSALIYYSLTFTLLLLVVKSVMELGLISPVLSALVFDTRSVIIGYLHLTLLGFISFFILILFQMVNIISSGKRTNFYGTFIFIVGFLINEFVLFLQGLSSWTRAFHMPLANEILVLSSVLLTISIVIFWISTRKKPI